VTADGHPDRMHRSEILNTMSARMYDILAERLGQAVRLAQNYKQIGVIGDLEEAIRMMEQVIDMTPTGYTNLAPMLNNLGVMLSMRSERTGAIDDLNRAVEIGDKAVTATPLDHPDRAGRLSNLGGRLAQRFERTGAIDDLNRAIEVSDKVVAAIPLDHPVRAVALNNLGAMLGRRFERTGVIDDLNRAIKVSDEAVTATPPDHPGRAGWLSNLGNRLGRRFERTGAEKDIKQSLLSFKEGWNCQNAQPSIRIDLARKTATILAFQSNWEESSEFLQDAVKLLPAVNPRSLKNTDKQHMLREFTGLASMAAAITLKAGKESHHALELLELGRGVIAGLLLEMRTDISDLKQRHRKIAEEFESLRDELDSPISISSDDALSLVSSMNRRREAGQKFDEIIARIRAQPGFQNFFLPPTADELMAAAAAGPIVVVNITSYRCDAFLIERHQIRVLELPDLRQQEVEERVQNLKSKRLSLTSTLEWLWHAAARPILDILGFEQPPFDDNWPHV
jgi:tetratricopeptide (TPR) repeat protein